LTQSMIESLDVIGLTRFVVDRLVLSSGNHTTAASNRCSTCLQNGASFMPYHVPLCPWWHGQESGEQP
jgi:hypothetical protein